MKIIGITGGVGSGKSLVLSFLADCNGIASAVIEADKVAHELQKKGEPCYAAIVEAFGKDILNESGEINRGKLGKLVFGNKEKLNRLNAIVHPLVKQEIIRQVEQYRSNGRIEYLFIEAALLIEEHYDEICEELWYIYVSREERIRRLQASRGYSSEKALQMMSRQLSEEAFRSHCKVVIDNNGSIEDTYRQLREVLAWQNG